MTRKRPSRNRVSGGLICLVPLVALTLGCGQAPPMHGHYVGTHSGIIVSVGEDHYHVEVLFVGGEMRFYTLDHDQTEVLVVPEQEVVAYIRSPRKLESVPVKLKSQPQPGDKSGQTSLLAGRLPDEFVGSAVIVNVPSIQIGDKRYRFAFEATAEHGPEMPLKVADDKERELYLTPGGAYTEADIAANGKQTASEKYRGFLSEHDFSPKRARTHRLINQTVDLLDKLISLASNPLMRPVRKRALKMVSELSALELAEA